MFLKKTTYIKNWKHAPSRSDIVINKPKHIKPKRASYITEEIGYWRKANAIHSWFVDNVQDGVDDCGEYEVYKKKMEELLAICERLLKELKTEKASVQTGTSSAGGKSKPIFTKGLTIKNPELAEELLPTKGGFFFGGTGYDNFYLQDLKDTVKILKTAIKECGYPGVRIYYSSSW